MKNPPPKVRCSNLPESLVKPVDCEVFDKLNEMRTDPERFIPILEAREKDIRDGGEFVL